MRSLLFLLLAVPAAAQGPGPVPVTVSAAADAVFSNRIEALGTVVAREAVTLTARVTEKVLSVEFVDGERVEAGKLLVQLERGDLDARLAQAKARLQGAESEWARVSKLARSDMATGSERDAQRTLVETARAEVATYEAQLRDRKIFAPFAGVVGLRRVSPGSLVTPGTVVATLDDLASVHLDFPVPAVYLGLVAPGQAIAAQAPAWPKSDFAGDVMAVDTRIDPVTRQALVRAKIPNEDGRLRPGLLMTVELLAGEGPALSVPEAALSPIGNRQRVFVVADDKAVVREVQVGRRQPGRAEILGGLKPGERVVVDGVHKVRPGSPVRVVGEAAPAAPGSAPPAPDSAPASAPATATP